MCIQRDKALVMLLMLFFLQFFVSCSVFQKAGLNLSSEVLFRASSDVEKEDNWELFAKATPAHLKLVESLTSIVPDNQYFLVSLIKGYVGYAYAVDETLYLEDFFTDKKYSSHKEQAIRSYERSLYYFKHFLQLKGLSLGELKKQLAQGSGNHLFLDEKFNKDKLVEVEALFYGAQALGSLANLQKSNMQLISHLTLVHELMSWVCMHHPDIGQGACGIFFGAYESGRPAALGGNPKKGRDIFIRSIQKWPSNYLIRVAFIQFYAIPLMDEVIFQEQKNVINNAMLNTHKHQYSDQKEFRSNMSLYNAIAFKRMEIIEKFEKEVF